MAGEREGGCSAAHVHRDLAWQKKVSAQYQVGGLGTEILLRALCHEHPDSGNSGGYLKDGGLSDPCRAA